MIAGHADFHRNVYLDGVRGTVPALPMTFDGLERQARASMDRRIFDYVAGGAGNERTQRANVEAFEAWELLPRMLRGAARRDLSVSLLGMELPSPLLLSPVGVLGVIAPGGELAAADASARTGVPLMASTLSEVSLEAVQRRTGDTPALFQLYPPGDRALTESLVGRAEDAAYAALVVTLDTTMTGWRPRDLTNAFRPQFQGRCLANYFSDPVFLARLGHRPEQDLAAAVRCWSGLFADPGLTWADLGWLRSITRLPLVLKGVCHGGDAARAKDIGADGVICSNHGGRQVDGAVPALRCLPRVVEAADDMPVLFDSGIRSGADAVKALALGASAVCIGRPYCYGLALAGAEGVAHVLRCLLTELDVTMGLVGCPDLAGLTHDILERAA